MIHVRYVLHALFTEEYARGCMFLLMLVLNILQDIRTAAENRP